MGGGKERAHPITTGARKAQQWPIRENRAHYVTTALEELKSTQYGKQEQGKTRLGKIAT